MKRTMRKSICVFLALMMVVGCFTSFSFGASARKTKSMTVYTQCVKDGQYVYCVGCKGIYKINLKNGAKTRLVYISDPSYEGVTGIKLHKGYIYYGYTAMEGEAAIYRVKTTGKSKKRLASFYWDDYDVQFVISGKKIYYKGYSNYNQTRKFTKRMKLTGKSKAKASVNVKATYRKTNATGYTVICKEKETADDYGELYYLRLPSGKTKYLDAYFESEG